MADISRRQLAVIAGTALAAAAPIRAQQNSQATRNPLENARETMSRVSATLASAPLKYSDEPMFTLVLR